MRDGHARGGDQPLGTILIEGDREGERVGPGIRDTEHFQDGRHAGFPRAVEAMRATREALAEPGD